jgi:methionine-gamma-lyase
MTYQSYHKRRVGNRVLHPETQMMGYGYDPKLSEGALKPPVSQRPLEHGADVEQAPG